MSEELRKLAEKWLKEQEGYPGHEPGVVAAAAVRLCAKELLAALAKQEAAPLDPCGARCIAWEGTDCGDKTWTHACQLEHGHSGEHKFPCKPKEPRQEAAPPRLSFNEWWKERRTFANDSDRLDWTITVLIRGEAEASWEAALASVPQPRKNCTCTESDYRCTVDLDENCPVHGKSVPQPTPTPDASGEPETDNPNRPMTIDDPMCECGLLASHKGPHNAGQPQQIPSQISGIDPSARRLFFCLEEIRQVASGEVQIAVDDTAGMAWIDKRAQEELVKPLA